MENNLKYLPIIGLEVHVELKTKSKMFCGCPANYFGKEPNTQTCPVCLGLPGALPVPNKQAIECCLMIGLALNCEIPSFSKFDRKNYFYPDLAKGYQISQYDAPLAKNGWLKIKDQRSKIKDTNEKTTRIRRVHMEEDTGKLLHEGDQTLIDFNRSGVPLVEIVTEPDIHSAEEAKLFLQRLQRIIRHLGVSDCDMEKGTMRLEPNISLIKVQRFKDSNLPARLAAKRAGKAGIQSEKLPNYKVEIKNINSFKFVERAINYEVKRQQQLLERGETIKQETRGWSEIKWATVSQRTKEEAHDYRYFPEPDIPPMIWKKEDINRIQKSMPESYDVLYNRFVSKYQLTSQYVEMALSYPEICNYFEQAILESNNRKLKITPKMIADYLFNKNIDIKKVKPEELIKYILSAKTKPTMNVNQLQQVVGRIISQNPKLVSDYKGGKEAVINVLIGIVMKEAKEQAQASEVRNAILNALKK